VGISLGVGQGPVKKKPAKSKKTYKEGKTSLVLGKHDVTFPPERLQKRDGGGPES